MPEIQFSKQQQKALDFVTAKMEVLRLLSSLDLAAIPEITIIFGKEGGRGKKALPKCSLASTDKEFQKVVAVMGDYKKRLIRDINDKAKKNSITFNEEELRLLEEKEPVVEAVNPDADEPEEEDFLPATPEEIDVDFAPDGRDKGDIFYYR